MTLSRAANQAAAQKAALADVLEAGRRICRRASSASSRASSREERYVQDVADVRATGEDSSSNPVATRELRVGSAAGEAHRAPPTGGVSRRVRGRRPAGPRPGERLTKLFLNDAPSAGCRSARILDESARFNIGEIARNINTPLFALQFLERGEPGRVQIQAHGRPRAGHVRARRHADGGAFRSRPKCGSCSIEEKRAGTMIGTDGRKDLPASGRFWIEPASGRVLMSELVPGTSSCGRRSTSAISRNRCWACWCRSRCASGTRVGSGARIEAVATYGKFRQFQVNVDEKFLIKK